MDKRFLSKLFKELPKLVEECIIDQATAEDVKEFYIKKYKISRKRLIKGLLIILELVVVFFIFLYLILY
jgi:hypothetical protein